MAKMGHSNALTRLLRALRRLVFSLGGLSLQLVIADPTVMLKGVNPAERLEAPHSILRGALRLKVRRAMPLDSVSITFIGEGIDTVCLSESNRRLLTRTSRTLIHDTHSYTHNRILMEGTYTIPFQFIVDPNLPETVVSALGSRRYHIEVELCRGGKPLWLEPEFYRPITVHRAPIDSSVVVSDHTEARGVWRGIMPYRVAVSARVSHLGGKFELTVETDPDCSVSIVGFVRQVKVVFVQKMRCPRRGDAVQHYTILNQAPLSTKKFAAPKDPYEPFVLHETVGIPRKLSFEVHPYTSNMELSDDIRVEELRITHHIHVHLRIHLACVNDGCIVSEKGTSADYLKVHKVEESCADVVFRAPLLLVTKRALEGDSPPEYGVGASGGEGPRSLEWMCTGGILDEGLPPKY